MLDELLYEARDGIGLITFNRPQARNALTFAMYERLAEIAADPGSIRALVITGAGEKAFAAGTDIGQFRAFATADDAIAYEARLDRVLGALERCPVPTIAAIAGACTGGGAGIAAACPLLPSRSQRDCGLYRDAAAQPACARPTLNSSRSPPGFRRPGRSRSWRRPTSWF